MTYILPTWCGSNFRPAPVQQLPRGRPQPFWALHRGHRSRESTGTATGQRAWHRARCQQHLRGNVLHHGAAQNNVSIQRPHRAPVRPGFLRTLRCMRLGTLADLTPAHGVQTASVFRTLSNRPDRNAGVRPLSMPPPLRHAALRSALRSQVHTWRRALIVFAGFRPWPYPADPAGRAHRSAGVVT